MNEPRNSGQSPEIDLSRLVGVYKKAKEENDERFMLERDEARAEINRVRGTLGRSTETLKQITDDLITERARSAKLIEAIECSIIRADDNADSWISRPIRDALYKHKTELIEYAQESKE